MNKIKRLIALLLTFIILLTGCANNRNILSIGEESSTTEQSSASDDTDVPANTPGNDYNYDFSIYDDGRTFSSQQISVQSEFEKFLSDTFISQMSENSISLHFSIEHPENYGIERPEPSWGEFDYMNVSDDIKEYKALLQELKSFDYNSLTYEQQLIYDMFEDDLQTEIDAGDWLLFTSAFAPSSGIQAELPIIFSEYDFLVKEDIDDYLTLLETCFDDYIKPRCEYETYRLSKGYSLSAGNLSDVIEQCREFISTSPVCIKPVFENKLANFSGLTDSEKETYIKRFDEAVKTSLTPGYELIISTLEKISKNAVPDGGLCSHEGGKEFYEYLVHANVGSSTDIDTLFSQLEDEVKSSIKGIQKLALKNPNIIDDLTNYSFPDDTPEEMLDKLLSALEEDFPKAVNNDYTINYVPESLESTMNPAYYVIPPIDNIKRNNIYINNYEEYSHMDLFPTIAHEGFPGHMYQTNYFYSTNPHYFRSLFSYNGYSEGWAHYVENYYSYKYAGMDDALAAAFRYNSVLSYAIYCITDIGINYYDWSYEDTLDYICQYFGEDEDIATEIYKTMLGEPAVYLRYFGGCMQILSLRETAEKTLGSGFDVKEFHKFLLEIGPCSFDIILDRMNDWINRVKGN